MMTALMHAMPPVVSRRARFESVYVCPASFLNGVVARVACEVSINVMHITWA